MPLLSLINSRHRMLPFISLWETTGAAETITLPTGTNYVVDWGDGTITDNTNNHEYANIGQYEIKIKGEITNFSFNNLGDKEKIKNVTNWGGLKLTSSIFLGCTSLEINATDLPIIESTSLYRLFRTTLAMKGNPSFDNWDVSIVSSFSQVFYDASVFNQPLNSWDVSNATSLEWFLFNAYLFNQPLDSWDVSNVTVFSRCFSGSTVFNQPLDSWDVSNATTLLEMFFGTNDFNQDLNSWDVSNLANMSSIFFQAHAFNGNITSWNTSNATTFYRLFREAYVFNQDISNWNTSNVTTMFYMFYQASAFNQDISNWDFSSVGNLQGFMLNKTSADYTASYYDNLLIKWDSLPSNGGLDFSNFGNVTIQMGTIKYTAAGAAARANLVSKGFIISDGGQV